MAKLLSEATGTGAGSTVEMRPGFQSVIAYGTTTAGAGSATINIDVSNSGSAGAWVTAGTLTVTLATTVAAGVADGLTMAAGWQYVRANITAISGTGAAVTVDI
jgi:hypothetical protein